MLARLSVATPFLMVVPDNTEFPLYTYEDAGYHVTLLPPGRSDLPLKADIPDKLEVNGRPAFVADTLRFDFRKDTFNREQSSPSDPPEDVIRRAVNSLITRLRYVTRGFQVSAVDFPETSWRLQYLQDDGSEIEQTKGLIRARGGRGHHFSFVGVNPEIWDYVQGLPLDWTPPRWHDLLLDANGALPKMGTALVLAATALEVFIADTLDDLARHSGMPESLWGWLNHRSDWQKDPSTEEQFDFLLHSLKEEPSLWESFKNVRSARNTFVHEGAARIGGRPVTWSEATQLVGRCREMVEWVRQWLPPALQWPQIVPSVRLTMEIRLP